MPHNDVIIALDFETQDQVSAFLDQFPQDQVLYVKVGMELFYGNGPAIINDIKARGHKIFLDLKLHDIPNTVYSAMKQLAKLDVDMVNVHASGGRQMMAEALRGLTEGTPSGHERPLCIAVTQLTSTDQTMLNDDLGIPGTVQDAVLKYAENTKAAGLDGVVCSSHEVQLLHDALGDDFLTITPGIRPAESDVQDQKRVVTPAQARLNGSDFIVVGRPITRATDPVAAYNTIKNDFTK